MSGKAGRNEDTTMPYFGATHDARIHVWGPDVLSLSFLPEPELHQGPRRANQPRGAQSLLPQAQPPPTPPPQTNPPTILGLNLPRSPSFSRLEACPSPSPCATPFGL
ncbi:hypothetical protein FDECE_14507 [Fusarium decemcellulare]|nr:hypothetical protein FDECE_14507 [Fusarium decemcellulare]